MHSFFERGPIEITVFFNTVPMLFESEGSAADARSVPGCLIECGVDKVGGSTEISDKQSH